MALGSSRGAARARPKDASIAGMVRLWLLAAVLLIAPAPGLAADSLLDARRLYNAGQYDDAERLVREALRVPATADRARLVLGRIQLERYRRSADAAHLAAARDELRTIDARLLDARERIELSVGLAEALFFENRFGAAAEIFDTVLASISVLGPAAHERALDWWATSLDRLAQSRPPAERGAVYERLARRVSEEGARDPASGVAAYWLIVAARGLGDLDRAHDAAAAGWVRALLARDRGVMVRSDIDRLMREAVLPERAARVSPRDPKAALTSLLGEWEAFKERWSR